nr:zinc finger, CCHC-type [Tanacetum cinerariifolium]
GALENYKAYDMIQELKTMFEEQAKQELFETLKAFHACKQEDGQSDYDQFVQNYNMHNMGKSIVELHAMLELNEKGIPKKAETPAVLAIREREVSHWRRDYLFYQAKLKKRKNASIASTQVFQNKVENQLGKKIKAIRFDQRGEYPSHEFVNHMKSYGYALEFAARILNMVPTKKVETMPYEKWIPKGNNGLLLLLFTREKNFVARNAEFFENSLMVQEASGSHGLLESSKSDGGLELIQEEDTQPSENTSEVHNEVAPIEVEPQILFVDPQGYLKHQIYKDDTNSQIGYVFVHNGGAVDWKSSKQSTNVMSSIEAEYITAAKESMEAIWMRKFIDGLRNAVPSNEIHVETIFDNEPTIAIDNDP